MPVQEIIKIRDSKDVEQNLLLLLAMHCAPLLKRMAAANVLTLSRKQALGIKGMLKNTEIECYILKADCGRVILYLYRKDILQSCLQQEDVRNFLKKYGYPDKEIVDMLKRLSQRIRLYADGQTDFPHEIGAFLGYPLADVESFIENRGKNYAYLGYWKVYHDVEQAVKTFRLFDKERERAVQDVIFGKGIREIAV